MQADEIYERGEKCWYQPDYGCRAHARFRVTGMGCDKTPLCIYHFVFEIFDHFYGATKSTIWSKFRKRHVFMWR